MSFEWPTIEQVIYRVMRLRRLLVLAILVPVIGLLIGLVLDPGFMTVDRALLAASAVAVLAIFHAVLFPNMALETISLSVVLTLFVLCAPGIKALATLAPPEHAQAVLILLVAACLPLSGAVMLVLQLGLGLLTYIGPAMRLSIRSALDLPCSPAVARSQYALQPMTRRGRIATGGEGLGGFFEVAILSPQVADPEDPTQQMVVSVQARVLDSDPSAHQVMLLLGNGAVTVTCEKFVPTDHGCRVEISELPGDFTLGMHVLFWLTDQQADNLTETADVISGTQPRANGLAHGVSFLSMAATVLSPRRPVEDGAK